MIALVLLLSLLCACDSGEGGGNNSDGDEKPITPIGSVGLAYEVNDDGVSCTIIGIGGCHDTEIIIPPIINSYAATSIGSYAFKDCTGLTSIKYRGSEADWNKISKDSKWDYYTGNYTITYNYTGE